MRIPVVLASLALLSGCVVAPQGATPYRAIVHPAETTAGPGVTYTTETRRQIAALMLAGPGRGLLLQDSWLLGPAPLLDPRTTAAVPVYAGEQIYCVTARIAGPQGGGLTARFHVRYAGGSPIVTHDWGAPVCAGRAVPFPQLDALSAWALANGS